MVVEVLWLVSEVPVRKAPRFKPFLSGRWRRLYLNEATTLQLPLPLAIFANKNDRLERRAPPAARSENLSLPTCRWQTYYFTASSKSCTTMRHARRSCRWPRRNLVASRHPTGAANFGNSKTIQLKTEKKYACTCHQRTT